MKTIKLLAVSAAALSACQAAALVMRNNILALVLAVILLAALTALMYCIFTHARIEEFLLNENKRMKAERKCGDNEIKLSEESHKRTELFALQYQINPHFLYNTLDTIRGKALIDNEGDIAQMAEKLARFFRYAISNREIIVRVEEEIYHIKDYISIQKNRFGDRFDTQIEVQTPKLHEYYMLKLLLQPLVENAIMHGLERLKQNGLVRVSIAATQKKLLIHIDDNGVGMPEEKVRELNEQMRSGKLNAPDRTHRGNGIAVQNVNARIKMIFGDEYGIHFRSELGVGTQVTITLPLVDDFGRKKYEGIHI